MTFGQQIQMLRKEKGLSQDALAKMLYVTRQSVSQWENDKAMPSVDLLVKLSAIFEISVDKLLGKDDEPSPVACCEIVKNKKEIVKACAFRFRSTVTLLIAIAAGIVVASLVQISIYPAVYKNLPYQIKFNQIIDEIVITSCLVIAAFVFVLLRLLFQKRVIAMANGLDGRAEFFSDSLLLYGNDGTAISYFYASLRGVLENDCYLYITLPNKQTIILDKSAMGEEKDTVSALMAATKNYKRKRLITKNRRSIGAVEALLLQSINNVLFVACIAAAICMVYVHTMLRMDESLSEAQRWFRFLLPWIIALMVTIAGIAECIRKIRAKRQVITGAAALMFLSALFFVMNCLLPVYNFNRSVLSPEDFLATAKEHNLTVREANREHLDDYLWECYEAVNEDGCVKITFMHFTEDLRWTSVRSARGAYDGLVSAEIAKTNNNNLFAQADMYCNACFTSKSENGRYFYISLNHYTIVAVSSDTAHIGEVEKIFADYRMKMPY